MATAGPGHWPVEAFEKLHSALDQEPRALPSVPPAHVAQELADAGIDSRPVIASVEEAVWREDVKAIRVGGAVYPFKRPLTGRFGKKAGGKTFSIEEFGQKFVGEGETPEDAKRNAYEQIHMVIQRVLATPEANRTSEQRNQWELISRFVDIASYERQRAVKPVWRGVVMQAAPGSWRVKWSRSGKEECVPLEKMPEEFAAYRPGDWFEARVAYDPGGERLLYVHEVWAVDPAEEMSPEEADQLWQAIPKADDLPKSGDDWTKL